MVVSEEDLRSRSERLGERLRTRGDTLAVAESLTGGLVGSTITDVPGSSAYFDRSVVTYAYGAKRQALAVPREELDDHGAVSAPVAAAMARGVRDTADTSWGLSTTGIAGPDGGTADKPVGLVFVGVAYAAGWGTGDSFVRTERFEFDGDRIAVKRQSVAAALDLLSETIETIE